MIFDMLAPFRLGDVVGALEGLEHLHRGLGMLFLDAALDHHAVVDRIDAGLVVEPDTFGAAVGEQRLDVGMILQIGTAAVDEIARRPPDLEDDRVQRA
jgi:hypothetical protein